MPTIYNKVVLDGTTLMDISDTTATASDVALGKQFYTTAGVKTDGTAVSSGNAISVVDTTDSHGGTIRTITAVDISDTTAIASDVASGKYFYTANGTKTLGTGSGSGQQTKIIIPEQTITTSSTYTQITLFTEGFVIGEEYIYTINGTTLTATCSDFYGSNMVGNTSTNTFFEYTPNTSAMYFTVNDSSLYGTYTIKVEQAIGTNGYTRTIVIPQQTVTPTSNDTYYQASLLMDDVLEEGSDYIITYNGTEYFFTCVVLWGTNYLLGDANYFFGSTGHPYPFGIIWISGSTCTLAVDSDTSRTVKVEKVVLSENSINLTTKIITQNGTYDAEDDNTDSYSSVTVNISGGGGSSEQTATGTITGDGTNILEIPCNFAPDLIYVYGDMSEDVANRGITSLTIIKDTSIYVGADTSTSSIQEYVTSIHGITGYNESDVSNIHATYSNGTLTINTVTNSSSGKWRSGQVYNYELSTIGTGGGSSSPTLVTKEITVNGTYTASNDSADGYSSVTVNVPSSGITPTGSISITTNGTHDVTNYASAVVNVSSGGSTPSVTQHSIYFEFLDSTNITVPIYYDNSSISSMITTSKPSTFNNKQVTLAQLDGTTWYSLKPIPLNTQLIDYTKMKEHYGLDGSNGTEEEYEWSSVTDYIPIDRNMTFTYVNYKWFGLYFYDTNKTYIRYFTPNEDDAVMDEYDRGHGTLDSSNIPSGAEYVRFVTELGANDANETSLIRTA